MYASTSAALDKRVVVRAAGNAAALAAVPSTPPTADATLGDIQGWRGRGAPPRRAKVSIRAAGAATLTNGLLVGWNAAASIWEQIVRLNGGNVINLSATQGYGEFVDDVAAVYTHLSVMGTLSASTLTAEVEPLEVLS